MDDRRKNIRIDAWDVGLRVNNSLDGEPLGVVGNLSAGGMMLITRRELFADGILQLSLETPAALDIGQIPVGVRILWCAPANSPDEFWAGLEIIDIAPADNQRLQQLLAALSDHRGP